MASWFTWFMTDSLRLGCGGDWIVDPNHREMQRPPIFSVMNQRVACNAVKIDSTMSRIYLLSMHPAIRLKNDPDTNQIDRSFLQQYKKPDL